MMVMCQMSHVRLESDECDSPGAEGTPAARRARAPLLLPAAVPTDTSYDSEISQTSSTSGYRLAFLHQLIHPLALWRRMIRSSYRASGLNSNFYIHTIHAFVVEALNT
jgi:hypothetical protein